MPVEAPRSTPPPGRSAGRRRDSADEQPSRRRRDRRGEVGELQVGYLAETLLGFGGLEGYDIVRSTRQAELEQQTDTGFGELLPTFRTEAEKEQYEATADFLIGDVDVPGV